MIELSGFDGVLRGIGVLYWMLAAGALAFAVWKGKSVRGKTIGALMVILLSGFLPIKALIEQHQRNAYAQEAWAHFKHKCDTEAGEKIYKTFTDVKSVLVVKPLPPATEKDLYDQFWYGDPYSAPAHSQRGVLEGINLASRTAPVAPGVNGRGLEFVEFKDEVTSKIKRYFYLPGATRHEVSVSPDIESRFGISWEDISESSDRKYWVAGSRLRITDLTDNSVIAERIGYFIEAGFGSTTGQRRPWLTSRGPSTTCPVIQNGSYEDRWFVLKILNPAGENRDGK